MQISKDLYVILLIAALLFTVGIFIFWLKDWARIIFLILNFFLICYGVLAMVCAVDFVTFFGPVKDFLPLLFIELLIFLILPFSTFYFFTRKNVKGQFH